jgi:raffinose/stachyose/melibiose transport system permease protein
MDVAMRRLTPYLFLAPAFLFLGVFAYWPFVGAFRLALYRSDGLGLNVFIGLGNFRELFADPLFWHGFRVMGLFALGLPLTVLGPLAGAMLIHNVRSARMAYAYRSALVIPVVVPMITTVLIWRDFYGPEGAVNRVLTAVGLGAFTTTWLGNTATVIPAMIFMGFPWLGGISMLLYLAGLINIPKSLYEAARIDGAGFWQVLRHVEAPLLMTQFRTVAILATLGLVQSYESILVMTAGGPANATLVPGLYLFKNSFEFGRVGYASALGLVLFALSLALTLLNMRVFRKHGY